jgi:hypothetical protein
VCSLNKGFSDEYTRRIARMPEGQAAGYPGSMGLIIRPQRRG